MFDMRRIGQCVRVYHQREVREPPPHPSTTEHMGHSIPQGDCGVCKLAWFPFGQKPLQKSLSRHYFWIAKLDQGQLYSVYIIMCLAYIPDIRWDLNKVIFLKKLLSNPDCFAGNEARQTNS